LTSYGHSPLSCRSSAKACRATVADPCSARRP
jgi:hypothetical protein